MNDRTCIKYRGVVALPLNKSGCPKRKPWRAHICHAGRTFYLGCYPVPYQAAQAADYARVLIAKMTNRELRRDELSLDEPFQLQNEFGESLIPDRYFALKGFRDLRSVLKGESPDGKPVHRRKPGPDPGAKAFREIRERLDVLSAHEQEHDRALKSMHLAVTGLLEDQEKVGAMAREEIERAFRLSEHRVIQRFEEAIVENRKRLVSNPTIAQVVNTAAEEHCAKMRLEVDGSLREAIARMEATQQEIKERVDYSLERVGQMEAEVERLTKSFGALLRSVSRPDKAQRVKPAKDLPRACDWHGDEFPTSARYSPDQTTHPLFKGLYRYRLRWRAIVYFGGARIDLGTFDGGPEGQRAAAEILDRARFTWFRCFVRCHPGLMLSWQILVRSGAVEFHDPELTERVYDGAEPVLEPHPAVEVHAALQPPGYWIGRASKIIKEYEQMKLRGDAE